MCLCDAWVTRSWTWVEQADDLTVPETDHTFVALIHAQTLGDFTALTQRGRRVLRVSLRKDVRGGFKPLVEVLHG